MYITAIIEGAVWSALWMIYVYVIVIRFPWDMLHDYPSDIQKAATLPEPSQEQVKKSKLFGALGAIVIFGTLIAFGLVQFRGSDTSFLSLLLFNYIIAMMWNTVDLFIMDWLIICRITPNWIVIQGTEGCKGYHDYWFYFKGFLIGCIYSAIMSLIFAGLDIIILKLL
ncbi:MAG: hypothetical protein IJ571_04330 [Ruminococcus sp.]|nr:hypothetical protein [Ruminococcus sp.]